jgi:hypothetical protein
MRRPAGPEYVERLSGSRQAKERLQAVLDTVAGKTTVLDACARLGICEQRFHQLRGHLLRAALASLEPKPIGRPRRRLTQADRDAQSLSAEVATLRHELRASKTREEIALVLPRLVRRDLPSKKLPSRRRRKRL